MTKPDSIQPEVEWLNTLMDYNATNTFKDDGIDTIKTYSTYESKRPFLNHGISIPTIPIECPKIREITGILNFFFPKRSKLAAYQP